MDQPSTNKIIFKKQRKEKYRNTTQNMKTKLSFHENIYLKNSNRCKFLLLLLALFQLVAKHFLEK